MTPSASDGRSSTAPRAASLRIAIIGGGVSGLAAALRTSELLPHARLDLFEASDRLGGVLDTVNRDGFLIERAADNFLTTPPAAVELCRQLGISDQLLETNETRRRAMVVRNGRLLPIPRGFYLMSPRKLWPILTSPLLSLRGKLRLLAEPLVSCRNSSPAGRRQGEGASDDESVASFARRRLGREAFERLVQPLVAGIYTADPEQLSMAATMPQFWECEREQRSLRACLRTGRCSDQSNSNEPSSADTNNATGARYALFAAPKNGMSSLIQAIADRLPLESIHLNTRVREIKPRSNGQWQIALETTHPQSTIAGTPWVPQLESDAVILALPAHAAVRLLTSFDPELAAELSAIPYAGCAVVSFGFARNQIAHSLDSFGFVVPQIERRRIIAASFASLKFPGRAPHESVLIRVFIGGALHPEMADMSDDELRRMALEELSDLLQITDEPRLVDIARWPASMPQYHVGHLQRVARIEQLAARHPNLALAGNAYHGVGIPQCIASGHRAAERIFPLC